MLINIDDFPIKEIIASIYIYICVLVFWSHSVWTKSLMCKDAGNRNSIFQSIFRGLCTIKSWKISDSLSVVRTTCHPVRMSICPLPSDWMTCPPVWTPDRLASSVRMTYLSVRTLNCIEKLLFQLASIRTSQQPVRTPHQ